MDESELNWRHQATVDGEDVYHRSVSYWRRAPHDRRFWLGLFLMVVAIAIFFMSVDLSLVPGSRPQ